MVSVSNDYKDAIRARVRDIGFGMVVIGDVNGVSTQYALDGSDIIDANADYPFSTNDLPVIGQVYSSTFNVTIKSGTIPYTFWRDAQDIELVPSIDVLIDPDDPTSLEQCQLGVFELVSRTSTDNFETYTIEAVDRARKLDVAVDASTDGWNANSRVPGLHFPYQYYADLVVNELLTACGVTLDPNFTFPKDYQYNRLIILHPSAMGVEVNLTARQYLGMIGGIFGANGMMTRDGYFTYKMMYSHSSWSVDSRDNIPLAMQYMGGLIRDREDPQYEYGGFYSLNPDVANPTSLVPTDLLGALYLPTDKFINDYVPMVGQTYTTGSLTFVHYSDIFANTCSGRPFVGGELQYRGMPWLECGDIVQVYYDYYGTKYSSYYMISNHTLTITGGLRGSMRCYTPLINEVDSTVGGSGTFTSASEAIASGALLAKFGVGSVVMTDSNTNPESSLGGTWSLIDKEFISQSRTATVSRNTTNFSDLSVTAIYDSHTITFVGSMTSSVSIAGTNLEVLTQTLTNNGASALASAIPFTGYCDSAHAMVLMNIGTDGRVRTLDVVVRGTGTSVASGNTFNWSVTCPCEYTNMEDGFCDKFYWQRTA